MKGLIGRVRASFVGRVAKAYGESKAGSYAAALAFNGFMTMFPLMLGLLSIIGIVIHDAGTQSRAQSLIVGIFPPDAHAQVAGALKGVKQNIGLLGLVSLAGLVWGGTSFFASIEFALTQIFGTRQRSFPRQRLMGALMMLVFLAVLLLTAGANAAVGSGRMAGQVVGFVVGVVILIGLLLIIYRYVPNRSFSVRQVWPGALVAGVLMEVISLIFPLYARLAHGFNTYGQQFALFFLLATWVYLLSQVLLLGAVMNRMLMGEPEEEGVLAEPGDRGQAAPRPADAIEAEREAGGVPAGRSRR
ncbi:MAG TPA: YihY/virulence factor BrkB family protein [Candidatus Dormibacteraeota bacterium]|nr:YihY/virulence factor BrkB family protein [Candidatus Dormibacteraeota bacterium]